MHKNKVSLTNEKMFLYKNGCQLDYNGLQGSSTPPPMEYQIVKVSIKVSIINSFNKTLWLHNNFNC